jgi:hypothetical protein
MLPARATACKPRAPAAAGRMDSPCRPVQNAGMFRTTPPAARLALLLLLAVLLQGSSCSWAFHSGGGDDDDDQDDGGGVIIVTEEATFGGHRLARDVAGLPGVVSARTAWQGDGPFLGAWLAPWTGHVRVSRVAFDPARLSLAGLLAEVHALRAADGARRVTFHARSSAQERVARESWPAGAPVLRIARAR